MTDELVNSILNAIRSADTGGYARRLDTVQAALNVAALFERWGTYLDPATYGEKYDHHTMTRQPYVEGRAVPVYRVRAVERQGEPAGDADRRRQRLIALHEEYEVFLDEALRRSREFRRQMAALAEGDDG